VESDFPVPVDWLDESFAFYALPGDFPLNQSACFRAGRIYGQDISSGAAVAALLTDFYDGRPPSAVTTSTPRLGTTTAPMRVLDLCCSPGLKLCAIVDWLSGTSRSDANRHDLHSSSRLTVVGVDISASRLAVTKKILQKYLFDRSSRGTEPSSIDETLVQLYCADGTTFCSATSEESPGRLVFDSEVAIHEQATSGKRKRMNKSARARERKRLLTISNIELEEHLFDRVLVDAECTTDGSLNHIQKILANDQAATKTALVSRFCDEHQLADLVDLQRRLAASGFRLLKNGGHMVYSTCSLMEAQNEGVVLWILEQFPDAVVVPVKFLVKSTKKRELLLEGTLPGTVRFLPNTKISTTTRPNEEHMFGGGFFLAKILKR
jgi:16S rRNA C967 or C1407 C5-methylase (RsmB/RsmF family)